MTIPCAGCGLPLESAVTEAEMLAEAQAQNPAVESVGILCQVCVGMVKTAYPEVPCT